MTSRRPLLLVHGGAGQRAMRAAQRACLCEALEAGYQVLHHGGAARDAVELAIRVMEQSGQFNAGLGARRQLDGKARLDAALMEGQGLTAGAVASLEGICHPITAARLVAEETGHVLLVGPHATRFARYHRLERIPRLKTERLRRDPAELRTARARQTARLFEAMTRNRADFLDRHGRQTVGAVAVDGVGTVAAGASTGGIDMMLPGRVGDTPLIGCGVYADNCGGAVSMTGWGESIIRIAAAKGIVDALTAGARPQTAVRLVLEAVTQRVQGAAGALVVTPNGQMAIRHTTPRMSAGYWDGRGRPVVGDRFAGRGRVGRVE